MNSYTFSKLGKIIGCVLYKRKELKSLVLPPAFLMLTGYPQTERF